MIEFPDDPAPNGVSASLLDFGFIQRPASGAAIQRIDRPGSRFRVEVSYPPMKPDTARKFIARLLKAKREGLRIDFPLMGVAQGTPGSPLVDGANPTGTSLPVRSLTPYYPFKEGYWITLIDAAGDRYLHNVQDPIIADAAGAATLTIEPAIRAPLADGSTILVGVPTVEGLVEDSGWALSVDQLVRFGGSIVIEEAA